MVALVERWLVRAGYHVTGVTTVPEALEALATKAVAWVITDLLLPTGDGMDILAYARRHQPQAKVIIMTAFGSEAARQRVVSHGAHAFLSKPFSGEALLACFTQEPASEPARSTPNRDQYQP
jgi:two-component system response regulator GlrR